MYGILAALAAVLGFGGEVLMRNFRLNRPHMAYAHEPSLRTDIAGDPGMNVGHWVGLVIGAMVLLIVVAALFTPLQNALASYAGNETTFGPILQTVVPILIGTGILLAFVFGFLPKVRGK